jgi:hypothetical protein
MKSKQCSAQTHFNLFFGKLDQLFFEPVRWWWPDLPPSIFKQVWEEVDHNSRDSEKVNLQQMAE